MIGDKLSSLDFLVFAYMNSIITNLIDEVESKLLLGQFPSIVTFVRRFDEIYSNPVEHS